jgi:hypothetical protein
MKSHRISQSSEWHSYYVLRKSRVQIFSRSLTTVSDDLRGFSVFTHAHEESICSSVAASFKELCNVSY